MVTKPPTSGHALPIRRSTPSELYGLSVLLRVLKPRPRKAVILKPDGSNPTPDFLLTLHDRTSAYVEVTRMYAPNEQELHAQFRMDHNAQIVDHHPDLALRWEIIVHIEGRVDSYEPRTKLAQAVGKVLAAAEQSCDTPQKMMEYANTRLQAPNTFWSREDATWSWAQAQEQGKTFKEWAHTESGYWRPEILGAYVGVTDHNVGQPFRCETGGPPTKAEQGSIHWSLLTNNSGHDMNATLKAWLLGATPEHGGIVRRPMTTDTSYGWTELVDAINLAAEKKIRQLHHVDGQKWLVALADWSTGSSLKVITENSDISEVSNLINFQGLDTIWVVDYSQTGDFPALHPNLPSPPRRYWELGSRVLKLTP